MTDAVKGVTAQPVKYEDGQYKRSRLSDIRQKALRTSEKERSVFKEEKAKQYKSEIPELTQRQANSFGKKTMQNERAAAVVDNRMVYIDKDKMEASKKAMPDKEHVYLNPKKKFDAKVRDIIAENPEDFYVDGEFSSDQYKRRLGGYTGFDNKANLDEIKTAAADYGVGDRTIRRAMKRAGYEREKDLTVLYKSLAALGVLGASTGVGALLGNKFTSNVYGIHNNGSPELLDTIISTSNSTGIGALKGLLAGVIPAVAAALLVKDNGGKDIFKGNTAEEIVAKGEKNIESRIRGEKNQKMMKAILKMPNLSNEDKAIILKLAYGELTGKKVNDRELVAAYEIAKYCNDHPEIKAEDYNNLPGKKPEPTPPAPTPTPTPTPPKPDDEPTKPPISTPLPDNDQPPAPTPQKCQLLVDGNDGVKTHEYMVRYKDNPYEVTKGLYKRADGKPMTHKDIMALRNAIFGKNKGLKVGKIQLEDTKTVNGVEYKYEKKEVKLGKVENVKLEYYKPKTFAGANYGIFNGCDETCLKDGFKSRQEANDEAAKIAKENSDKYTFIPMNN